MPRSGTPAYHAKIGGRPADFEHVHTVENHPSFPCAEGSHFFKVLAYS